MERYKIDIGCLQETKINNDKDEVINGFELTCFPTKQNAHGMGFIISKKWKDKVSKMSKVNHRTF